MSSGQYADDGDTNDLLKSGSDPLAIHLANALEKTMQFPLHGKAADELRRLSAELFSSITLVFDLTAQRNQLLEALQDLFGADMEHVLMGDGKDDQIEAIAKAKAAIAKATGAQV